LNPPLIEYADWLLQQKNKITTIDLKRIDGWRNIYFKNIFWALCFFIFLFPFSISVAGDGVSANYAFILTPVLTILYLGKIQLPTKIFLEIIFMYLLLYFVATIVQNSYFVFVERRAISFVIFMSIFSCMFIKIDSQMVQSFKLAVVAVAIFQSLQHIFLYFLMGGVDMGYQAKGLIGSQRYGFVYVLAIWLLLHYIPQSKSLFILKIFSMLILGAGLLLTFSRSGIVAIIASLGLYVIGNIFRWLKRPSLPNIISVLRALFLITLISVVILLLCEYFSMPINFYLDHLFSLNQKNGDNTYDFNNSESSEGYRVKLFYDILEFIFKNPFLGSGYLGVWILFDDLSGSAHNQYLDVLFRTGVLGFSAYVFLICRLLRFLYLREPGLYWGVIGILIYGLVHETFKLSHGAFILAFLLGMMVQPRSGKPRANLVP